MGHFTYIMRENVMFQFGISFWQNNILRCILTTFCQKRKLKFWNIFLTKGSIWRIDTLTQIFKFVNVLRFKSALSASSMFPLFFKSKTTTFNRIESGTLKILQWSSCVLLPFVRKGQSWRRTIYRLSCLTAYHCTYQ